MFIIQTERECLTICCDEIMKQDSTSARLPETLEVWDNQADA